MKYLIGIFTFLTSFTFSNAQDSIPQGNQRAWYPSNEQSIIDTTKIALVKNQVYFQFHTATSPDSLPSRLLRRYEGKPQDYFICYLVNNTDSTYLVNRQDGSLIMIREALNEKGSWTPIEYWVYSGCGNSYFNPLELKSGNAVKIPMQKYSGDFNTQIRLKFKNRGQIIYSDPYSGSINKSLFQKETNEVHGILYHGAANYLDDE